MLEQISLNGKYIRLEPLSKKHKDGLIKVIEDGKLWELFVTIIPTIENIKEFIDKAIEKHQTGNGLTFIIINKNDNNIVGSTSFMNANLDHKKIEIGYTFLAKSIQKTFINTETKLLMLTYAFETLKLNRVELLADFFNHNSQNAITRLGAKKEGILRNHMIMPNGRVRDSVVFSIINNEWVGIKEHLNFKLHYQQY